MCAMAAPVLQISQPAWLAAFFPNCNGIDDRSSLKAMQANTVGVNELFGRGLGFAGWGWVRGLAYWPH
jgi:hypothetical protein